uniref:Uncharacterized protein n=1 Tax=Monodelphis domestica TaxID=13616 RepID=A0A5F8G973_MONDO
LLLEHRKLCCCFQGMGQMLQIGCLRSWASLDLPLFPSLLRPTLKPIILDSTLSGYPDLNYGLEVAFSKELEFLSYWRSFLIRNSAVFISFPQSQGRPMKSCQTT